MIMPWPHHVMMLAEQGIAWEKNIATNSERKLGTHIIGHGLIEH